MITDEDIADYYEQCEKYYRSSWDLDHSMAMHFGYWDKSTQNLRRALRKQNEVLAELSGIKREDLVLDIGCGVGGSSIFLAKNFGCEVIGITISDSQVKSCEKNARKIGVDKLTGFQKKSFTDTGFDNSSFDVVWAIESFCHSRIKRNFVKESYRILKPEGRLIIADGFSTKERYSDSEKFIMNKWLNGWKVPNLMNFKKLKKTLSETGFDNIQSHNATENIMPSSLKMRGYALPAFILGRIFPPLKRINPVRSGNAEACYYQFEAWKQGLAIYGIVKATKQKV